jgi:hypothetical protein
MVKHSLSYSWPRQEVLTFTPAENVSRSRNGTVRNTDSFFKDDSAEPKKISLTPNLLRDEANNNNANNNSNNSNNIFANELKEVGNLVALFVG